MMLNARGWDAGQQAMAASADVQAIVGAVLRHPSDGILDLVDRALYHPTPRTVNPLSLQLLVKASRIPLDAHAEAYALAEASMRICNLVVATGQKRRRGMVLTALTAALLNARATCLVEVEFEIATGTWTNPQDAVVDGDPLEVIECKSGLLWLDQDDVDALADIAAAASAVGRRVVCAVATLNSRSQLANRLATLAVSVDIYSAAREDLLDLMNRPASFQVAP